MLAFPYGKAHKRSGIQICILPSLTQISDLGYALPLPAGFIVLYPLGVASELAMCYLALPTIRDKVGVALPLSAL